MKIHISNTKSFKIAAENAAHPISNFHPIPILSAAVISARGGKCTITTSNLDLAIRAQFDAEIIEEGEAAIPCDALNNILGLSGTQSMHIATGPRRRTKIQTGTDFYEVFGFPPEEAPSFSRAGKFNEITVRDLSTLIDLLAVKFAMSKDETRRTINGILLQYGDSELQATATDGRRLAIRKTPAANDPTKKYGFILPTKTIDALVGIHKDNPELHGEPVSIKFSESQAEITIGPVQVATKLIEGCFPDYQSVIPTNTNRTVVIDRLELLRAAKISKYANGTTRSDPRFTFGANFLSVRNCAPDRVSAKTSMAAKLTGDPITIGFAPEYVADFCRAVTANEITIRMTDHNSAAIFEADDILCVIAHCCIASNPVEI